MEQRSELQIRAKKISDLGIFTDYNYTIEEDGADAWLVLAFTKNGRKENYKINLLSIANLIRYSDEELEDIIRRILQDGEFGKCGCADKLADLQRQIDELRELLSGSLKRYMIAYVGDKNITPSTSNPEYVVEGETLVAVFIPATGYAMKSAYISGASNADAIIDYVNATVTVPNVQNDITITAYSELRHFTLTINAEGLDYVITGGESADGRYSVLSGLITIKFTAKPGYSMPQTIRVDNANQSFDPKTGISTIRCAGTGNMIVTAEGVRDSQMQSFGICCKGIDDDGILEYAKDSRGNEYPNGTIHFKSSNFYTATGCPLKATSDMAYSIPGSYFYGEDEVWVIVPKKYFKFVAGNNSVFLDDENQSYNVFYNSIMKATLYDYNVYDGMMDGIEYTIVAINSEGLGSKYIQFVKEGERPTISF